MIGVEWPSSRIGAADRAAVAAALGAVRLDAFAERMADALSGGERQRVAIGRALLAQAEVVARTDDAPAIWLKSMADALARRAYDRWGFRTVGDARLDNDIPARSAMVVMRKEIAA